MADELKLANGTYLRDVSLFVRDDGVVATPNRVGATGVMYHWREIDPDIARVLQAKFERDELVRNVEVRDYMVRGEIARLGKAGYFLRITEVKQLMHDWAPVNNTFTVFVYAPKRQVSKGDSYEGEIFEFGTYMDGDGDNAKRIPAVATTRDIAAEMKISIQHPEMAVTTSTRAPGLSSGRMEPPFRPLQPMSVPAE